MSDTTAPDVAVSAAVIALEIFTDPSSPPTIVELTAEVAFDGDAYVATDDDGRYVTQGYASQHDALRALMAAHLEATTDHPTRHRNPSG